jgi:hypothetical protein
VLHDLNLLWLLRPCGVLSGGRLLKFDHPDGFSTAARCRRPWRAVFRTWGTRAPITFSIRKIYGTLQKGEAARLCAAAIPPEERRPAAKAAGLMR